MRLSLGGVTDPRRAHHRCAQIKTDEENSPRPLIKLSSFPTFNSYIIPATTASNTPPAITLPNWPAVFDPMACIKI